MSNGHVDFHCHLDLYPDFPTAIKDAEAAGVFTLTVTTTPKAWTRNNAALGLHPQLVNQRADEIELWEKHLQETRYVGEVGLDAGPRYYRSLEKQKNTFLLAFWSRAQGLAEKFSQYIASALP